MPTQAHPGGADAWSDQDLFVSGVTAGAPPDEFNQRGQDWGSQPWHPERLAERRFQPLADLIAAAVRSAGALRIDHVMGLGRLWWVPPGMTPDQGTYVRYNHVGTVGVLVREAVGAGVLAIGEDLGTNDPWIRDYLADHGVAECRMSPHGYGKTNFVATNKTAEGRAQNRRVELVPNQ